MKSEGTLTEADWDRLEAGEPLDLDMAARILDSSFDVDRLGSLAIAKMGPKVTFSRNATIPVTRLCRNRCLYCGFRRERGEYLRWPEIAPLLRRAKEASCCEALIMSGERPELVNEEARDFLSREGFGSTPEYVAWLCGRILDETDLLPHTNLGSLDAGELEELRKVNASMGMMLEDASERLCEEGMPHQGSPGKDPHIRIETIEEAGRQKIPFTTGILVGIGQTNREIARSLITIKDLRERYGHIQEVIVQRFVPNVGTEMEFTRPPTTRFMMKTVSVARMVLGSDVNVQVPPNIEREFELMIKSGANDLGGISPLTRDEINPGKPWCSESEIFKRVSSIGYRAELRPPVYREFAREEYLTPRILERTKDWLKRFEDEEGLVEF
jgi:7,8-didemethyl-8-hydroxy-5-deazariboflavin synthase CofG subunit